MTITHLETRHNHKISADGDNVPDLHTIEFPASNFVFCKWYSIIIKDENVFNALAGAGKGSQGDMGVTRGEVGRIAGGNNLSYSKFLEVK